MKFKSSIAMLCSAKMTSVLFFALLISSSSMMFRILPMLVSAEATTCTKWVVEAWGLGWFKANLFAEGPALFPVGAGAWILVTNLIAMNWFKSRVEIGVFFFQGMTSFSFCMMNAIAASSYLVYAPLPNSSPCSTFYLLAATSLGVPSTDPETTDWLCYKGLLWTDGLTNLKAKDVLKPKSILCLSECHKQPDLDEFLVEVILSTFDCWSNRISPS